MIAPETPGAASAARAGLPAARALLTGTLLLASALMLAPAGISLWGIGAAALAAGAWLWTTGAGRPPGPRDLVRLAGLALFALVLNALFAGGEPATVGGRALPVSASGLRVGAATGFRLAAVALLFQGLARAASPLEVTAEIERLLRPWRGGARAQSLALICLVALRLAPALALEARRLAVQRALRGPWPGPAAPRRVRERRLRIGLAELPGVLVPLVLLALRRAEELAWALPARYYGLGPRTPPRSLRWRARDWAAVAAGAALCAWAAWARSSA